MARFLRSISVELKLTSTANGSSFQFPDVPQLKNMFVQGVEAFTDLEVGKTPTQTVVIADAAKNGILVNFVEDNLTKYENIPYFTLIARHNGGLIREFKNWKVNINKSGVYIGDNTSLVINTAVFFTFYYTEKPI